MDIISVMDHDSTQTESLHHNMVQYFKTSEGKTSATADRQKPITGDNRTDNSGPVI